MLAKLLQPTSSIDKYPEWELWEHDDERSWSKKWVVADWLGLRESLLEWEKASESE